MEDRDFTLCSQSYESYTVVRVALSRQCLFRSDVSDLFLWIKQLFVCLCVHFFYILIEPFLPEYFAGFVPRLMIRICIRVFSIR